MFTRSAHRMTIAVLSGALACWIGSGFISFAAGNGRSWSIMLIEGEVQIMRGQRPWSRVFWPDGVLASVHHWSMRWRWPYIDEFAVLLPLWCIVATAALVALVVCSCPKSRRALAGRCAQCGYNLTGNVSGRCPECGMPVGKGESGANVTRRAVSPHSSSR